MLVVERNTVPLKSASRKAAGGVDGNVEDNGGWRPR
jgi:hypothetical protein